MGRYEINCIVHDANDIIVRVGIGDSQYTVQQIVDWIRNGEHTFYTIVDNVQAEVYARQRKDTGTWFLTTNPNGVEPNNLDSLPQCGR